jgi:predicted Zn-dependent peptidase
MKTKYIYILAIFFLSVSATAQIDRSVQPKPGPAPKINLGSPQTFELKNGLKVIVVENHKLPRVSATLTIDNTPIFEGEKAGISSLLSSLLGSGTTNINKDAFNEEVDYLGADLSFGSSSARLNSLSKYFPRLFEMMADAVQNPLFIQEDFDKEVNILLDGIKSEEKSVDNIAGRMKNLLAYGKEHPYGEFVSKETVENIKLSDVANFYNAYFKPNNAYLIIVGDVNFKKVKKLVTTNFKKWNKGVVPSPFIPEVKNVASTEIDFINMPNAVQSNVAVISTTHLKMNHPDYFAVKLANYILGGGGQGRLFLNLREDKAYTYGSYSNISSDKNTASAFTASAKVRNIVTDSAAVEILKEIKKITIEKVTDEELKNTKATYIGSFVRNVEKPETVARYALNIRTNQLPNNFYETYLDKINAVSIEDIQRVSKKYFNTDNSRIVIVGKALDVIPNLEKLPYPINYYDTKGNKTEKPELTKPIPAGVSKETVINSYFDAIGGVEKIKEIKSTLVTYEASAMGSTVQTTEKRTATHYANTTSMGGNVLANITMSKDGVFMNKQPLPAPMASEMTNTIGVFLEMGLLNNEKSILSGIEPINGKDAYAISTKGEIVSTVIYFDVKTGLKVKESQTISTGGQTQSQDATYSDYKEFNGIKFPETKNGSLGPQKIEFKLIDAQINKGVTDKDFE